MSYAKYTREGYDKQREKVRIARLKRTYNLSPEDYNAKQVAQEGKCKICGVCQYKLDYLLYVDHNHTTGKVRGLLCRRCNSNLAVVEDQDFKARCERYLAEYA